MNDENVVNGPQPQCRASAALMTAAALGADMPQHERDRLARHLADCAPCRERFQDYAAIAQLMAMSVPEATPPPELRMRIVATARRQQREQQLRHWLATPRRWSLPWRRSLSPALGLVAVALLAWGVAQQGQIHQLQAQATLSSEIAKAAFGNPDGRESILDPTVAAPGATGRIVISPGAPAIVLYVNNLPPLPENQVYQVWLFQNGQFTNIGVFTVDPQGRAWKLLRPQQPLASPQRINITIEPAGGSQQPTGPVYLAASL